MKARTVLPEVTVLHDARGARPQDAAGAGEFWYEPEVWSLPLSPASKVLYVSLCSFLSRGQINHKDLRNVLKDRTEGEVAQALAELVRHAVLVPNQDGGGYVVRSVRHFEG
ncbi:MAG: hypothetical protein M3N18_11480 [Actinomycetota bacterium]|nr:hypothetical protein [Actinomycetota bacterium]